MIVIKRQGISALTSLRFFAAFFVFIDHFIAPFFMDSAKWGVPLGYVAITFFFTLSGFVLTYAYQAAFYKKQIKKFEFYMGRIARIWPLHILCIILTAPFAIHAFQTHFSSSLISCIANILLLQDFIPHSSDLFNDPSWSISAEMFFYLCFPFLVILALKKNRLFNALLFCFLSLLIILEWGFSLMDTNLLQHHVNLFSHVKVSLAGIFYVFPLVRIIDFGCGIFLYFLYAKYLNRNYGKWLYTCCEVSSVIFIFISYFLFQSALPMLLKVDILYLPATMMLILSFSFSRGALSKSLSLSPFILLGEVSFGFYMLQVPTDKILLFFIRMDSITFQVIHLFILIALSILIHRYFEMPCYLKIRRFFSVKQQISFHNYLT